MRCLAVPALLAATAEAFWTDPLPGRPTFTIGTDLVLEYTVPNPPPAETFTLTLRAENSTPYAYVPGPFGSTMGLYDLRDRVIEQSVPLANGSYSWTIEPIDIEGTFKDQKIWYFIRADWHTSGISYKSGDSTDLFFIED